MNTALIVIAFFIAGIAVGYGLSSRTNEKKIIEANKKWQQTVDDLIDIVGTYLTTEDLS